MTKKTLTNIPGIFAVNSFNKKKKVVKTLKIDKKSEVVEEIVQVTDQRRTDGPDDG